MRLAARREALTYRTMHNYRPVGENDKSQFLVNAQVLQEYVDFNTYNIWVPGHQMVASTGSLVTGSFRAYTYAELPDATGTTLNYSFRKPRTWGNGIISGKIWFTGTGVAATNVALTFGVRVTPINSAIAVVPTLPQHTVTAPSTTGAISVYDGFMQIVDESVTAVGPTDGMVAIRVTRLGGNAADTYTSTLQLLGIEVVYREKKHQIAYRIADPNNRNQVQDLT